MAVFFPTQGKGNYRFHPEQKVTNFSAAGNSYFNFEYLGYRFKDTWENGRCCWLETLRSITSETFRNNRNLRPVRLVIG